MTPIHVSYFIEANFAEGAAEDENYICEPYSGDSYAKCDDDTAVNVLPFLRDYDFRRLAHGKPRDTYRSLLPMRTTAFNVPSIYFNENTEAASP